MDVDDDLIPVEGPDLPFPMAEFERRVDRVRCLMAAAEVDVLLVSNPSNIAYLTGLETAMPSVFARLVVPSSGELRLVCAVVELPTVLRTSTIPAAQVETVDWLDRDGTSQVLAAALAVPGVPRPTVGAELTAPETFASGALDAGTHVALLRLLGDARVVDVAGLILQARATKSPLELDHMREAARLTEVGLDAALRAARPGARETDLVAAATAEMARAGSQAPAMGPLVAAGRRTGWGTHLGYHPRLLTDGPVYVELSGACHGYSAPAMGTATIGRPSDVVRRLADAALQTLDRLTAAIRPGRVGDDVAREVGSVLGSVPGAWFHGAHGYSVGLAVPPSWTEAPVYLAAGSTTELRAGMTFNLPICTMVPGVAGVGFGWTVVVTEKGCELLAPTVAERQLRDWSRDR